MSRGRGGGGPGGWGGGRRQGPGGGSTPQTPPAQNLPSPPPVHTDVSGIQSQILTGCPSLGIVLPKVRIKSMDSELGKPEMSDRNNSWRTIK